MISAESLFGTQTAPLTRSSRWSRHREWSHTFQAEDFLRSASCLLPSCFLRLPSRQLQSSAGRHTSAFLQVCEEICFVQAAREKRWKKLLWFSEHSLYLFFLLLVFFLIITRSQVHNTRTALLFLSNTPDLLWVVFTPSFCRVQTLRQSRTFLCQRIPEWRWRRPSVMREATDTVFVCMCVCFLCTWQGCGSSSAGSSGSECSLKTRRCTYCPDLAAQTQRRKELNTASATDSRNQHERQIVCLLTTVKDLSHRGWASVCSSILNM